MPDEYEDGVSSRKVDESVAEVTHGLGLDDVWLTHGRPLTTGAGDSSLSGSPRTTPSRNGPRRLRRE